MASSRHGIVSAAAAQDARAVQQRLNAAPAELRRLLDATAGDQLSRAWAEELDKQPATPQQRKFVLDGAVAIPNGNGLSVRTGVPGLWPAFEFGTNDREATTTYYQRGTSTRAAKMITRRTRRQLPTRKASGYIAYPAANKLGVRVFNMWAEIINKVAGDALDGGNR